MNSAVQSLVAASALGLLTSCLLAHDATASVEPKVSGVIGEIVIQTHDVFDLDSPQDDKLIYRAANKAHVRTRDAVVRRELLFTVGDDYDPALVAETERNLRALPFIRRAETLSVKNSSGTITVFVRTYDSWTFEVVAGFRRAGGIASEKVGLAEHNLFGDGKSISGVFSRDDKTETKAASWSDPQFLRRKHLRYAMSALEAPGVKSYAVGLSRPFFASITPRSMGFTGSFSDRDVNAYTGDVVTGTLRKHTGEVGLNYGVALTTSTSRARRISSGLLFHRAYFDAARGDAGARSAPEQLISFQFGADWETLDFVKERHVQKFSHEEDFNLGLAVIPSVSWAPAALHSLNMDGSQVLPSLQIRKGFRPADQLAFVSVSYASSYVNQSNSNRIASLDALLYYRGLPSQTVTFHTSYDHGWRLDPSMRLTVGETNGLRGYGLNEFAGDRRWLGSVEDLLFVKDEFLRLADIGLVGFFDSGYVWPEGTPERVSNLRNSVGFGVRVAPSRSSDNSPVRIDLARALSPNGTRSRWSLSIQAGHAFGPITSGSAAP
jgi:outer membrane protein assembly factor BamA